MDNSDTDDERSWQKVCPDFTPNIDNDTRANPEAQIPSSMITDDTSVSTESQTTANHTISIGNPAITQLPLPYVYSTFYYSNLLFISLGVLLLLALIPMLP